MFLLALLFVASASAVFLRPPGVQVNEREICIPVFGVASICADPHVSGKREEDLTIAEIVANIGKVVHVIDGFVSGTAKREEDLTIAEIIANIGKVVHVIDGFVGGAAAKREDIVKRPCIQVLNVPVCL